VFGICLSLVANIGSAPAPALSVLQVTVAACPPLVLLLAVELLNGALKQRSRETGCETAAAVAETSGQVCETGPGDETVGPVDLVTVSSLGMANAGRTAEERMWEYYVSERTCGRTPTGAELDRVAGTHNYGRRILRKWRAEQDRQVHGAGHSATMDAATPVKAVTYSSLQSPS
jgi:hypothetical protein